MDDGVDFVHRFSCAHSAMLLQSAIEDFSLLGDGRHPVLVRLQAPTKLRSLATPSIFYVRGGGGTLLLMCTQTLMKLSALSINHNAPLTEYDSS